MGFVHQTRLLCGLITLTLAALVSGCAISPPAANKLNAEEIGYTYALSASMASPTCRGIVEGLNDYRKFHSLQDEVRKSQTLGVLNQNISSLRRNAAANIGLIRRSLPPASMSDIHNYKTSLFEYLNSMGSTLTQDNYVKLESMCLKFYQLNVDFLAKVAAREAAASQGNTITLTFQPTYSQESSAYTDQNPWLRYWPQTFPQKKPLPTFGLPGKQWPTVGFSQSVAGFQVSISLETSIGTLTAAYANSSGAKLLIIRSRGYDRYFSLSQPFRVFVPTDFGVSIAGDGQGTIVVEVVER